MMPAAATIPPTSSIPSPASARHAERPRPACDGQDDARSVVALLDLLAAAVAPQRRIVRAGDAVYRAGERFAHLHVLGSGCVKIVNLASDGREQVVALKFRGDWLGLDGIAEARHGCDAVALDTGEVWSFRYDALLTACHAHPRLLTALHAAMSREIGRERDSLMSICTLPAAARVANFLAHWAETLERRGLRNDQITLRLTRAEIGNYLGMTLETVSRALSTLARRQLIAFAAPGRRDLQIPDADALSDFVQECLEPDAASPQALRRRPS